ncbi:MAG: DUF4445 domain-containing protein [Bacteroidales bacterium]|nr:MAG: DUF4445 domain-containing protein [Bacteroidales bacterium]
MSDKIQIKLVPLGIEKAVGRGTPLTDILFEHGVEFPCGGKGTCGRCSVKVLKGKLETSQSHERYAEKLNLTENVRLACMCRVEQDVELEIEQYETFVLADNTDFNFTPRDGYGIAIDLGTTTIVGQLVNLSDGKILNVKSILNPQARYGADIMSRIEYAVHRNGQESLMNIIRNAITGLIRDLIVNRRYIPCKIVIVGNAVMQHIFCGIDLTPLSMYPFESMQHVFFGIDPAELEFQLLTGTEIIFYPAIGSFVGSDILAGIMATGIQSRDEIYALIDLGTNGEIVAGNKDEIFCASTAAGPAFEGTNISMGMTASAGAVSSVNIVNGEISCHTIGNIKPRGICGSGLMDAIAVLLQKGMINPTGEITSGAEKVELTNGVVLTQKDIREFQLAKGAVAAGMEILAGEIGLNKSHIERIFIAGAFGNFINPENASRLGLLEFPVEKITRIGNTALIGAKMALFQDKEEWEDILQICRHKSLESSRDFQDIFASKMSF